jgi:hypothetical protein
VLAWKQHTVPIEDPRATECQAERSLRPGSNPAEDSGWVKLFDLVFPTESDVDRDEGRLHWIQARPQGVQGRSLGLLDEEGELPSGVLSGGQWSGVDCVA